MNVRRKAALLVIALMMTVGLLLLVGDALVAAACPAYVTVPTVQTSGPLTMHLQVRTSC